MSKLIHKIQSNTNKQIFISSHSSYVANKLGVKNIILVYNGQVSNLSNLSNETMDYFKKLPGYNTLRVILANEAILVEGPADDLIVQKAYLDKYDKLPIEDGIDVISLNSLSFKRYCDIALLINKKIKIITDNDGDIQNNILNKYRDYLDKTNIKIFYEKDPLLNTLEPSLIAANTESGNITTNFRKAISKNDSMISKNYEDILKYMTNNKTEWSMRVFDNPICIRYPQHILDAIEK